MIIRDQYNYNDVVPYSKRATTIEGKSMTKPNMALSIQEILNRSKQGQEVAMLQPAWYSEEDIPEWDGVLDTMDNLDKLMYAKAIRERVSLYEQTVGMQQNEGMQMQSPTAQDFKDEQKNSVEISETSD